MVKFPPTTPQHKVVKALQNLGFRIIREDAYVSMVRENRDKSKTALTIPVHQQIMASTLAVICTQARIVSGEFFKAYNTP